MSVLNTGFLSLAVIAYSAAVGASTIHTWGDGGTPAAGDEMVIPSGVTATVADETTYNNVRELKRIRFADATSRIVFDVPAGKIWTVQCTIRGDVPTTPSAAIAAAAYNGGLVKKGGGDLEFIIGNHTEDYEYFVYTPITVESGAVVMPQNYDTTTYKKQCFCGPIAVSNGAYFVTSRVTGDKANISYGVTQTPELWGEGTVSNRLSEQRFIVYGKKATSEFRGTIGWSVRYYQTGYANLLGDTTGSSSTTAVGNGGVIGVKIFGNGTSAASIPMWKLDFASSGTFKYLGSGETTSKAVITRDVYSTGPAIFDGGTNGALVLSGKFEPADLSATSTQSGYMHLLAFDGDHPNPCELSGSLSSWTSSAGLPATYTVAKRGTGTWRFSNDSTPWSGALFVENGTLQATSIGNIGEACSLGYATNRTAFAKNVTAGSTSLPYAICLGSSETAGTIEYVGDGRVDVTNRPIALTGMGGGIKNSSSSGIAYRGIYALADATFTVSGDTGANNVVADVCDGVGKVSLVKDGSGFWTLDGTNSFSGTLTVKAGTLYVNDPTKYSWFRWVLKERWLKESDNNDANVRVAELGIYDDQNRRINGGLVYTNGYSYLRPGSLEAGYCAIDRSGTHRERIASKDWPLNAMFDDGTPIASGKETIANVSVSEEGASILVDPSDSSTWIPVVMHLTNGTPRAASFDVVQADNSTNTNRYFKGFDFEGSVDGIHWDSLTNVTVSSIEKGKWVGSGTSYSAGSAATHTGGYRISGGPAGARKALERVESVSVANGARLVSYGDVEIRGLTVDLIGAGAIENFSFVERGVLNVVNLPSGGGDLPGIFIGCSGVSNIAGWTLKVEGVETLRMKITTSSGGGFRIVPRGLIVSFR